MAGALDYLFAGAKDFAQDVNDALSGNMRGPNFGEREKLFNSDAVPRAPAPPNNLGAAATALNLTPQERALYQVHLKNLWGAGGVDNPDGSRSTLYQTSFEANGRTYNVHTIYDGKIIPPHEAIDRAVAQGLHQFPSYASQQEAEARYQQMHQFMERDTADFMRQRRAKSPTVTLPATPTTQLGNISADAPVRPGTMGPN